MRGDHHDPAPLREAMTGASAAFLLRPPGPDEGQDAALVAAAGATGVRRLVKLSAVGTGEPALGPFGRWHVDGERAVRESGAEWVVLRPSTFASNSLSWAGALRAGEPVPNMTGDGTSGVIDPRDVAAVAVRALLDGRYAGRTFTLTGPEAISLPDQVAVLASVLGRPLTTRSLAPDEIREFLRTTWGFDDAQAEAVVLSTAFVRDGGNAAVTADVPEVLGRPARTYRAWARAHTEAFGV
ncbi:NAD(P)H-binding protein [Streptomyces collinus]|uniref:NAD(P)H-binding protein n=1 Tax=Streptomyces collinus TaxID=42684 RepID=UPI001ED988A9|nr:NAD(P)H-binding protein [Streptomyces collinus]